MKNKAGSIRKILAIVFFILVMIMCYTGSPHILGTMSWLQGELRWRHFRWRTTERVYAFMFSAITCSRGLRSIMRLGRIGKYRMKKSGKLDRILE